MPMFRSWLYPALHQQGRYEVFDIGQIELAVVHHNDDTYTCASMRMPGDSLDADYGAVWSQMATWLTLAAFISRSGADVVSSRLEPTVVEYGKPCKVYSWTRMPPPVSIVGIPAGVPIPPAGNCTIPPCPDTRVQIALSWFMRAFRASDAFERMMYLWMCLEALAPEVREIPKCQRCQGELSCAKCKALKPQPRVLESIRSYLEPHTGRKTVNGLYEMRSKLVHGRLGTDAKAIAAVAESAMYVFRICLEALSRELNVPFKPVRIPASAFSSADLKITLNATFKDEEQLMKPTLLEVTSQVMYKQNNAH